MTEKGCLMVDLDIPKWKEIVGNLIPTEDIYDNETNDYGIEFNPHITILYGLDTETKVDDIKKFTFPVSFFQPIIFLDISTFESDEYDVVKFKVFNPQLNKLNSDIKNNFKYENSYPNYVPHCTLAYVKKGMGLKYCMDLRNSNFTSMVKSYSYSQPNSDKIYWTK